MSSGRKSGTNNHDDSLKQASHGKNLMCKSYDNYLEKKGYKLGNTIGNGSYAKVKIAEYMSKSGDRKKIAVKIIDKSKVPDDFLNKFLPRELEIYAKLDHPNIIKVYDIIHLINRVYVFMELAELGDLLDFIRKQSVLSNSLAKRMFNELAHALKYCHALQLAHRDLKCENILLDRHHNVKLADFGFARSCVDSETNKRILSKTYCGSAAYAAPEILQVCGKMPFDDSDVKRMIKAQHEAKYKTLSKNYDKLDPLVKDLIQKMLEPDITKRANIDKVLNHPWLK